MMNFLWPDETVMLSWRTALPVWAWALLWVGSFLFGAWSYSRLIGPVWVRLILSVLRMSVLLWVSVLLAGPMWVQKREVVEPDHLIVLVDRSASMQIKDTAISRDQQIREALTDTNLKMNQLAWTQDRQTFWYGFDQTAYPLKRSEIMPAQGSQTAIASAIEQVLDRHNGHPISAITIISDGRSHQPVTQSLLHRLKKQAVSVFVVPVGSDKPFLDLKISQVDFPDRVFVDDLIPIGVWLSQTTSSGELPAPARIRVQLVDTVTEDVVAQGQPTDAALEKPIILKARVSEPGLQNWRVSVIYDPIPRSSSASDQESSSENSEETSGNRLETSGGEQVTDNNHELISLEVIDDPLRVLYIEGYPRWEYRYLKNILIREESIESTLFLVSADEQFAQEGETRLTRLGQTAEQWRDFDVIILGDVPANYFSSTQLGLIRDQVATQGTGLIWVGGEYYTPRTYDASVLSGLLPFTDIASVRSLPQQTVALQPTELARQLNVLSFQLTRSESADATWPTDLPPLRWLQQGGALKPAAEVLAVGQIDSQPPIPLITRMRYGSGQSIYVATDDLWRWRFARGDFYYQQGWTQLIRLAARSRIATSSDAAQLTVSHRRLPQGQDAVVTLHVRDALFVTRKKNRIRMVAQRVEDDRVVSQFDLLRQGEVYRGIFRAPEGRLKHVRLRPADISLFGPKVEAYLQVVHQNDEQQNPAPDHEKLIQLANATGGQVIALDQLATLAAAVPNRARHTPDDRRTPLGQSYPALLGFLVLITLEWMIRKLNGLV